MPLGDLGILALTALLAILLSGALAPFEALGWWAGWFGRPGGPGPLTPGGDNPARHFVVFLSGIHSVSGASFARREIALLETLRARLTDTEIVEVFPYSVTNRALTGQRVFARFWRWALRMKMSRARLAGIAGMVINVRNLWQVAVSADRRYGPYYNHGTAELILEALERVGYRPERRAPVTLIGFSGGGQIAVGAAGHLKDLLDVQIRVICLGGVVSSDQALLTIDRLYYLSGRRDNIQRLAALFFPGRWALLSYSPWNQAKARGILRFVDLGPVDHTGRDGYMDSRRTLADGRSYLQQTVDAIAGIIAEGASEPPAGGTGGPMPA